MTYQIKQSKPLVSIIMPAYNAAKYISEAIQSVQQQDYPHWELIIIDDGSTDDTLKKALTLAKTDNRIKILPLVHQGSPAAARNAGLVNAYGEMIAFLDADDRFEENALSTLVHAFTHSAITAVYGFSNTIDEASCLQQPLVKLPEENGKLTLPHNFSQSWKDVVLAKIQCLLSASMIRKSTINRIGLFDERWVAGEDYQFFARLYLDNFEGIKAIPAYIYQYRVYGQSLTKSPEKAERILQDNLEITDWVFEQQNLPQNVQHLKSQTLAEAYRYLSRERLINNQSNLSLWLITHAWNNPNVVKKDWLFQLMPLFIRSLLGYRFNQWLIQTKQNFQSPLLFPKQLTAGI